MAQEKTPYHFKAHWLENWNCDSGCNCNFGGFPDHGNCEGIIGISITEGMCGSVDLSGAQAVLAVKWPGAIHQGHGKSVLFMDEKAKPGQVEALAKIITGQFGGLPWEIIATTMDSAEGPVLKPIEMTVDGKKSSIKIDGVLEAKMTTLKNPVTQEDHDVEIVLPKGGLIWNKGVAAKSETMRVSYGDLKFEHPGQSSIYAFCEWSNQN